MSTPISEIMTTPVLTVDPDTHLGEIADAMLEKEIKSIAAIDEDCVPVGILTSTDFIKVVSDSQSGSELTVRNYMTTDVVTVTPEKSVQEAASTMVTNGISHLPVTESGDVVGIVTATDIASYVSDDMVDI